MKRLANLAAELARRNLTEEDVANHIGRDRSRVSRILCCHVRPRMQEKKLIAALVGLPIRNLFPRRWRLRRHNPMRARRRHRRTQQRRVRSKENSKRR